MANDAGGNRQSPGDRTSVAPLLASLGLHLALLLSVAALFRPQDSGSGSPADRAVGIAMIHRMPDRDRYVDAAQAQQELPTRPADTPAATDAAEPQRDAAAPPPSEFQPPIDLDGVLRQLTDTPTVTDGSGSGLAGDATIAADAFADAPGGSTRGDASRRTASLFGVSGSGSRFVYVLDRSDSMNQSGGGPLRAAKAEVIRSLSTLSDQQQFQIVFYNDQPKPFDYRGTASVLIRGDEPAITQAQRYVGSIKAFGGTSHEAALKLALRMSPDVIFFLTDARVPGLSGSDLIEIRRRAQRSGTAIYTIEFGTDAVAPADSFLIDLARQNGGDYQYIDVARLSD